MSAGGPFNPKPFFNQPVVYRGQPSGTETVSTIATLAHVSMLGRLACRLGMHRWMRNQIGHYRRTPGYPFIEFGWVEDRRSCVRCGRRERVQ
jgi:hypothetical protein